MDLKTQKLLAGLIANPQKNKASPYATTGTVTSVLNNKIFVKLSGSDISTPISSSSVMVNVGDTVDVSVSHTDTHITGNRSDVATPASVVKQLDSSVAKAQGTMEEMGNVLEFQNNKIQAFDNAISLINNVIDIQNSEITSINDTINSQGNTITQIGNTVNSQGNTITEIGNTVNRQGNTITELNSNIETLNSSVKTHGSNITILNSAFTIENGTLKGLSNIIVNSLETKYASIDLANINAGCITTAMIGQGAVNTAQIADGSITDAKIVTLTANKINAGTLSVNRLIIRGSNKSLVYALNDKTNASQPQPKLYDTINGEILTNETITTDKIVAEAITAAKIASKTITANQIAANAITTEKINAGSITANKIAANAITTEKINAGAITADKIASNTITAEKIVSKTITADKIDVDDLFAQNINATGQINGLYGTFNSLNLEGLYGYISFGIGLNERPSFGFKSVYENFYSMVNFECGGFSIKGYTRNVTSYIIENRENGLYIYGDKIDIHSDNFNVQRINCGLDPTVDNSVGCSNWFRSSGNTGWYNQTYGGGIYMTDDTWVKVYNGKKFYCQAGIQTNSLQIGDASTNGGLELYHATPFIDFHFGKSTNDYTHRIIATDASTLNCTSDFSVSGTIKCPNWFCSSGTTGWYNETYGGGIYMTDTTWVRVYNGKKFYCQNTIQTDNTLYAGNTYAPAYFFRNVPDINGSKADRVLSDWNTNAKAISIGYGAYQAGYATHIYGSGITLNSTASVSGRFTAGEHIAFKVNGRGLYGKHTDGSTLMRIVFAGTSNAGAGGNAVNCTMHGDPSYRTYLTGASIYASKSITQYSDMNLKDNFEFLDDRYLLMFDYMTPELFTWKTISEDERKQIGYVAQMVLQAMQDAGISESENTIVSRCEDTDNPEYGEILTLDYNGLSVISSYALKRTRETVKKHSSEIEQLYERLEELERKIA